MKAVISVSFQKIVYFTFLSLAFIFYGHGQSFLYDDFEGAKMINYGGRSGVLDTSVANPASDQVNSSSKCALYIRNGSKKFDNIKMNLPGKLTDVTNYATYSGIPPKLKLKVYTTAPAGTLVEILLGSKGRNNEYPEGTNSQYQAYTSKTKSWEELEFKFSQIPEGSQTSTEQIDQITLLFNPNSLSSDSFYFDELSGPPVPVEKKQETAVIPGNSEKKDKKK
jgi:hypothetical protein